MAGYFRYEETYMRRRGRCTKILDREVGCDLKSSPHTHGRTYSNSPARPQPTNTNGNHLREREREREIPKTLGRCGLLCSWILTHETTHDTSRATPHVRQFFSPPYGSYVSTDMILYMQHTSRQSGIGCSPPRYKDVRLSDSRNGQRCVEHDDKTKKPVDRIRNELTYQRVTGPSERHTLGFQAA